MNRFQLDLADDQDDLPDRALPGGLGGPVLLHNAQWFIRIRWLLALLLAVVGLACTLFPQSLRRLGVVPAAYWPWVLAAVLVLANTLFVFLTRRQKETSARAAIEAGIWLQIVVDLSLATVLVHLVGSTSTIIPFVYLFHIAVAGVSFSRRDSLMVTLVATGLYVACVSLEILALLPARGLLAGTMCECQQDLFGRGVFCLSVVMILGFIWYLLSTLSKAVRARDRRLQAANERILKADEEQNRQVLRTTHDLKTPFTGIETSIQVLRFQHWDQIPGPVQAVIERIERRAARLRRRISDILLVGALRSESVARQPLAEVELRRVVTDCVEQVTPLAESRRVVIRTDVAPETAVVGDARQLSILVANLVSNAVTYSREGGTVDVSVREDAGQVVLTVRDEGLGISADDLPHIFDDYFRTEEAAETNKMSTGLGLAMVKEIATKYRLGIAVASEEGQGTVFEVTIPRHSAVHG